MISLGDEMEVPLSEMTERRQAEQALRESEERFRALSENLTEAALFVYVHDQNGHPAYEYLSSSLERLTGVNPEAALQDATKVQEVLLPECRAQLIEAEIQSRTNLTRLEMEICLRHAQTGRIVWALLRATPYRRLNGSTFWYGVLLDITAHKLIEAAEHEQRALAEALRDTAAALSSTLKFEDVLDRILDNVGRVMLHEAEAVDLILLDTRRESGWLVRHRSTRGLDLTAEIQDLQFSIAHMRNLREIQATGAPVMIADCSLYEGWLATQATAWIRASLGVPITSKGEIIGFLILDSATPNVFSPRDTERLRAFADQAALAIENARLYEEVQAMAITDALTGVLNQRGLFQVGEREVERALRFHHPLSMVMLDLDHFKLVNDTYGHVAGDHVLRALAALCRAQVRDVDIVARYGGEEFVVLLLEVDLAHTAQLAERLRQAVEALVVPVDLETGATGINVQVTVSLGITSLKPEMPDLTALFARADQALYLAKAAGRNCVRQGQ